MRIQHGCGLSMFHRDAEFVRKAIADAIEAIGTDDPDRTVDDLRKVAGMFEDRPEKHQACLHDYSDGADDLSQCVGCGAVWIRTDEVDVDGKPYEARTLVECGDGSCNGVIG